MAGSFLGGMGAGIIGSGINKAMDYGFGLLSMRDQIKAQRKLRRSEYQDMMHSMRKAGLNPMLASGATPGHTAVSAMNIGGADVMGGSAKLSQADTAKKVGAAKEGEAYAGRDLKKHQQGLIAIQGDNVVADTNLKKANTRLAGEQTATETAKQLQILSSSDQLDASAKEVAERTKGIRYLNEVKALEADLANLPESEWLRRIQAWSAAIQGAHSGTGARAIGKGR